MDQIILAIILYIKQSRQQFNISFTSILIDIVISTGHAAEYRTQAYRLKAPIKTQEKTDLIDIDLSDPDPNKHRGEF